MGFPGIESFSSIVYPEFFIGALLISGISGLLFSMILKLRIGRAAIAFVGATVSLFTFYALWRLGFAYNFIAALIVAVAIPVSHQLYRFRHARSD